MKDDSTKLTPDLLLHAYQVGVFPMSEGRDDPEIFWVEPRQRGIIPIGGFHISRSLAKALRTQPPHVTYDTAFDEVVTGCADRTETWINPTIRDAYRRLFDLGFAHSAEVWAGKDLIGGVYGVAIGSAFFGESMFSRRTNGSKIALAYLMDRLALDGFTLFDTQFLTPHLASLGGIEVPRGRYRSLLEQAIKTPAQFSASAPSQQPQDVIQRSAQTS